MRWTFMAIAALVLAGGTSLGREASPVSGTAPASAAATAPAAEADEGAAAAGATAQAPAGKDARVTLEQAGLAVTLRVPTGWDLQEGKDGVNPMLMKLAGKDMMLGIWTFATVEAGPERLELMVTRLIASQTARVRGFTVRTKAHYTRPDGRKAAVVVYETREKGTMIVRSNMIPIDDKRVLVTTEMSVEREWPDLAAVMAGVTNSLKFEPAAAATTKAR